MRSGKREQVPPYVHTTWVPRAGTLAPCSLLKGKHLSSWLPDLRNQPYIRADTGRRSARRRPPGPPLQVTSDLSL